jgi:hypothetical protein
VLRPFCSSAAQCSSNDTRFEPSLEAPGAARLSEDGDVAGRARVRWGEPLRRRGGKQT